MEKKLFFLKNIFILIIIKIIIKIIYGKKDLCNRLGGSDCLLKTQGFAK